MSAICLIDTSIFVEILDVPMKASQHKQVLSELKAKIQNDERLFLPMATILETWYASILKKGNLRGYKRIEL